VKSVIDAMSLQSEFGNDFTNEDIDKYGKRMLDKYGLLACQEASKLEDTTLSQGSLRSYKPQVRDIVNRVGEKNPDIEDTLQAIKDCDKEGSTKSVMVSAIKKYFEAIGEVEKAENFHIKAKKSDIDSEAFSGGMEVEEWLTVDEVEKIDDYLLPNDDEKQITLGNGDNQWVVSLEHKAMFETLYYTGCRVGELQFLQVEDFNFDSNDVRVYRLKKSGNKPKRDMIAIPQEYVDTMEAYIDMYDIEGDMFRYGDRTIQNRIKDLSEAYIHSYGEFKHSEKLTPHKLRHARVTAIANSSGIDKAGEFVDHSSVETTKAYRHLAVEEQRDILPEEKPDKDSGVEKLISMLSEDSDGLVETIADKSDMSTDEAKELVENAIQ